MAAVIELKTEKPPVCSECEHHALSTYGVFCTLFNDHVSRETVAEECEAFEREDP